MRYDREKEKDILDQTNEELIKYMRDYPKETLSLASIGHSISNGFSVSEPGKLLLNRNLGLIDYGKKNGVNVETFHLSRWENNNALSVADWIRQNLTEKDTDRWNRVDYRRAMFSGKPLLNEDQIQEYFTGGSDRKVQDVIFDKDKKKANIVILNLGTGSFLDIVTRHGSLTIPNLFFSVDRDVFGISSILELIQNSNRKEDTNTQVYLCGAPRIANTLLSDIFMNPKMKRVAALYANVTYVPSFPRQAFYKTQNGAILPDPHYNQAEYYHFLSEVEKKIIDNYLLKDLLIDLDRLVFQISDDNDVNGTHYTKNDMKDIIDRIAKKYESKTGDYNYFIDMAAKYIGARYPYDFFRLSPEANLKSEVSSMKRHK
jgi:hypothetical protein